jgi:PAS domain S-box-containing protein
MIVKPFHALNGSLSELSVGNGAAKRAYDSTVLLAEETKYRLLVEHIPAITYIAALDAQSSTLYTSPQIAAILGFSQAEWIADHTLWLKQIHSDDRAFVLKELARIRAGGDPTPCEYRMLARDGHMCWFIDDAVVVRDTDGYPFALYGVMIDITKQKRLEAELAEMQRQLEETRKPRLSRREMDVLRLLRDRRTDKEISKELAICERTVRNCVKGMCVKLGIERRADAVLEAMRLGLLEE